MALKSEDLQKRKRKKRELKNVVNVPVDKELYERVKRAAERKFPVYPSAYANAWLVREYKKRGGKYKVLKKKPTTRKKSVTKKKK
jgi:hypothetical protein